MLELWVADPRDLIKWGVLVQLARDKKLRTIVQVPYLRKKGLPHFCFDNERLRIAPEVWDFFRNIKSVERLGKKVGVTVKVIKEEFSPTAAGRKAYLDCIGRHLQACERPLLLFLDPDTGLEPTKATVEHATESEIKHAWHEELQRGDWLVLYQHRRRGLALKAVIKDVSRQVSEICGVESVKVARSEEVGKDVALLCLGPKP